MKTVILIYLIVFINCGFLIGQNADNEEKSKVSKGRTELEFTFFGVGLNRLWKAKQFSYGFGIGGFRFGNIILYSNSEDFNYLQKVAGGFANRVGYNVIKLKCLLRKQIVRNLDIDLSTFISYSVVPGSEDPITFPGYGIELSIYYFKFNRVRFSTSLFLSKSFNNKNHYLQLIPLKVILLLKHK